MKKIIIILLFCTSPVAAMEQPQKSRKQTYNELLALATSMIEQKKDLNTPFKDGDYSGKTILTATATNRAFKDILKLAIKAGADVNKPDGQNHTPVKIAVAAGCRTALKYLIRNGARLKDEGLVQEICSPLHDTFNMKKAIKRTSILETILHTKHLSPTEKQKLANEIDGHENTALYHLLWAWLPPSSKIEFKSLAENERAVFYMQRKKMISLLLQAGLNVGHVNRDSKNAVDNIDVRPHLKDPELLGFLMQQVQKNQP